jgi:hypothetical protein
MPSPRDWTPSEDDPAPESEWIRRDHEWSWGGNHVSSLSRSERLMRTGIRWMMVAMLAVGVLSLVLR